MMVSTSLAQDVAALTGDWLHDALRGRGAASLALTGGATPATYLPAVFDCKLDWSGVRMTLADDRMVALEHPDSNEGMILGLRRETRAGAAAWTPLLGLRHDAMAAAAEASSRLPRSISCPLDVVLLGIGEDGHIASLFPGSWRASDETALCLGVPEPPAPHRHPRVSLSLDALAHSHHILLILKGAAKRAAYERSIAETGTPLAGLAQAAGTALHVLYTEG
jgi:6-phosphogluconolactonase